jgi:hypothetical protein
MSGHAGNRSIRAGSGAQYASAVSVLCTAPTGPPARIERLSVADAPEPTRRRWNITSDASHRDPTMVIGQQTA